MHINVCKRHGLPHLDGQSCAECKKDFKGSKTRLEHYYSDFNGVQLSKNKYHETPSEQTTREAMTLGRVQVGDADIICQEGKYLVVIKSPSNGLTRNVYRDMYRIV